MTVIFVQRSRLGAGNPVTRDPFSFRFTGLALTHSIACLISASQAQQQPKCGCTLADGASSLLLALRLGGLAAATLSVLVEHVGEAALAAVLAVEMRGHKGARPAVWIRADAPQAGDLTVAVNLIVFERCKLHLLVLVLDLLRLRVPH